MGRRLQGHIKVEVMTKKIIAIHGAYSSPVMFNYLRKCIKGYDWVFFDYHASVNGFQEICNTALDIITEDCHVVGHSMGGLIALWLAGDVRVKSITTIATPLNGLDVNLAQVYLSRSSFIKEVQAGSRFIRDIHAAGYPMPVQHIITTEGFNPYMNEPNDGVVTMHSQHAWRVGEVHEIAANHSEIMQHESTVKILRQFWSTVA